VLGIGELVHAQADLSQQTPSRDPFDAGNLTEPRHGLFKRLYSGGNFRV